MCMHVWLWLVTILLVPSMAVADVVTETIQLEKTVGTDSGACAAADFLSVPSGTEVTYCYTVTHTGPITSTIYSTHTLTDSELGILFSNMPITLVPGGMAVISQTVAVSATVMNLATWTAMTNGEVVTDTDMALVEVDDDGDGLPNETDPDPDVLNPTGCFYNELTGEIVAGGLIEVSGPSPIVTGANGSSGCYQFSVVNAGTYTINILQLPEGCILSAVCADSGTLTPASPPCQESPVTTTCTLGSENVGGTLAPSFACADNPYALSLNLPGIVPDVLNNNIPLNCSVRQGVPVPSLSRWGLFATGLVLVLIGLYAMQRSRKQPLRV